jgi:hypothetical protein
MLAIAIDVLAFLILVGLFFWVLSMIPGIPDPIRRVIYIVAIVVLTIILVMWMVQFAGTNPSFPGFRR